MTDEHINYELTKLKERISCMEAEESKLRIELELLREKYQGVYRAVYRTKRHNAGTEVMDYISRLESIISLCKEAIEDVPEWKADIDHPNYCLFCGANSSKHALACSRQIALGRIKQWRDDRKEGNV